MKYLTDAMFTAVLNTLPSTFDSHAVIRGLMTQYPKDYVKELFANVGTSDPIRETHREIGQKIATIPGVTRCPINVKVDSANIRGPVTENQGWRK